MDSISNDFSHLSVRDLHASSEPITAPALNRIPLQRDTLTDHDHKVLNEKIMKAFSAFRKLNEEPHLPSLLSNLTVDDRRLVTLRTDEAEDLLKREPSITKILKNAWQAEAFKEVRQLGAFPVQNMCWYQLSIA
jgi:hypothetical protein